MISSRLNLARILNKQHLLEAKVSRGLIPPSSHGFISSKCCVGRHVTISMQLRTSVMLGFHLICSAMYELHPSSSA